ncbi:hypothetical protein KAX35_03515 [candidate division WOR-3 bacterium]|nr:hypothetical protein [candidate division WOR-3 bacterium]
MRLPHSLRSLAMTKPKSLRAVGEAIAYFYEKNSLYLVISHILLLMGKYQ